MVLILGTVDDGCLPPFPHKTLKPEVRPSPCLTSIYLLYPLSNSKASHSKQHDSTKARMEAAFTTMKISAPLPPPPLLLPMNKSLLLWRMEEEEGG